MIKDLVIGIDPGKSGGIATIYNNRASMLVKMPGTPQALVEFFRDLGFPSIKEKYNVSIYLEKVHAMPRDGSRQAFTFGKGVGVIEGVLAAFGLHNLTELTSPQVWMKHYGLKREKLETKYNWKKRLKEFAFKECPRSKQHLISLETADAFLIAKYGVSNEKSKSKQDGFNNSGEPTKTL